MKEYNKLVRDKIPTIIEADGKRAVVRRLSPSELKPALEAKLHEELAEYLAAGTVEELADLVEVVYALVAALGVSREKFERVRQAKAQERGGFSQGIFLVGVEER